METAVPVADPGSSGEKHEIYVATFDSHLFYDLFLQGPLAPLDPLLSAQQRIRTQSTDPHCSVHQKLEHIPLFCSSFGEMHETQIIKSNLQILHKV